ncbi:Arm DNA-binding domain-containing protein [Bradyrhizobium sp. SZCCHNRI1058]|uniref:Arm DNA-binding domain-containing protein n=1 Tax=Bradyrhizobium sp. SZCCHNRI1058 TaxID=3057279 RepID=UPI002916D79C|nr:Arm DNA-binding domain-containing protein [Bradyrhizobium sp. SZCCHNRI1058]
MKYRFGDKEKLLSFGPDPATGLDHARQRRDQAKKLLASGIDPSEERRKEKITASIAQNNTFGAIAAEYIAGKAAGGTAATTITKLKWLLEISRHRLPSGRSRKSRRPNCWSCSSGLRRAYAARLPAVYVARSAASSAWR